MKFLKGIIFLIFFAVYHISLAEDIPYLIKNSGSSFHWNEGAYNWNWVPVVTFENQPLMPTLNADFTRAITKEDGTQYLPVWKNDGKQYQDHAYDIPLEWMHVDCSAKTAEWLGQFKNGQFKTNSYKLDDSNKLIYPMYMYCGVQTTEGLIYGIAAYYPEPVNDIVVGWVPDKIETMEREGYLKIPMYSYYPITKKIIKDEGTTFVDCKQRSVSFFKTNIYPADDPMTKFFFDSVCNYKKDSLKIIVPRELNTKIKSNTNQKIFEDSKSKCQSLGFKAGTEKFGDCVLELSK